MLTVQCAAYYTYVHSGISKMKYYTKKSVKIEAE